MASSFPAILASPAEIMASLSESAISAFLAIMFTAIIIIILYISYSRYRNTIL